MTFRGGHRVTIAAVLKFNVMMTCDRVGLLDVTADDLCKKKNLQQS